MLIELRALEGEDMKVVAKVNDYNLSKSLRGKNGEFREQIDKTVWMKAIEKVQNLKVFYNHQNKINLAKEVSLRAEEDGVYADITLFENARGLYDAIKNGQATGMSFGFRALKDSWEQFGNFVKRSIEDMELFEISILDVAPAYNGTQVYTRAVEVPFQNDLDMRRKQLELLKMK